MNSRKYLECDCMHCRDRRFFEEIEDTKYREEETRLQKLADNKSIEQGNIGRANWLDKETLANNIKYNEQFKSDKNANISHDDFSREDWRDIEDIDILDSGIDRLAYFYGIPEEALPRELFDFIEVIAFGAKKYAMNNWLEQDGKKTDFDSMHASMHRHLAASSLGIRKDHESRLDPLLHLACRALMLYTRLERNIGKNNTKNLENL